MQDQKEIEENFPFFTMITSGGKDYFGIVQNQDNTVTSFYDYDKLGSPEEKKQFVSLAETWWWESNRLIPINIFLRKDVEPFKYCIVTMNSKDVKVSIGPTVNLNNMSIKRIKRKNVQLVKKPRN